MANYPFVFETAGKLRDQILNCIHNNYAEGLSSKCFYTDHDMFVSISTLTDLLMEI